MPALYVGLWFIVTDYERFATMLEHRMTDTPFSRSENLDGLERLRSGIAAAID